MAEPTPNERRITAPAKAHGWHIHSRDDLMTTVEYRKRGHGYLRVSFGHNGHVIDASTTTRPLRGTAAVLAHLESQ